MPATFKLTLNLEESRVQGYHLGANTNAAILNLIEGKNRENAVLSKAMHDRNPKPYHLDLEHYAGFGGNDGARAELRIHIIQDSLIPKLQDLLKPNMPFGTKSNPLYGHLSKIQTEFDMPYTEFVTKALDMPTQRRSSINFLTSTSLSAKIPTGALPIPLVLLNGLRIRFEEYSGYRLEGRLNRYVENSFRCLECRTIEDKIKKISDKEEHHGFVGNAVYMAEGAESSAQTIALLLRFAEWSGVGENVAAGFGHVQTDFEAEEIDEKEKRGEILRVVRSEKNAI